MSSSFQTYGNCRQLDGRRQRYDLMVNTKCYDIGVVVCIVCRVIAVKGVRRVYVKGYDYYRRDYSFVLFSLEHITWFHISRKCVTSDDLGKSDVAANDEPQKEL